MNKVQSKLQIMNFIRIDRDRIENNKVSWSVYQVSNIRVFYHSCFYFLCISVYCTSCAMFLWIIDTKDLYILACSLNKNNISCQRLSTINIFYESLMTKEIPKHLIVKFSSFFRKVYRMKYFLLKRSNKKWPLFKLQVMVSVNIYQIIGFIHIWPNWFFF